MTPMDWNALFALLERVTLKPAEIDLFLRLKTQLRAIYKTENPDLFNGSLGTKPTNQK